MPRGSLPSNQTLGVFFLGESKPVNQGFADILLMLHISEQSGRGVPKIIKSYGRDAYGFREKSIVIKIPLNWINEVGNKAGNKVSNKPLKLLGKKIYRRLETIEILQRNSLRLFWE